MGEELLEQIGIVLLGYIWVAPVKASRHRTLCRSEQAVRTSPG